MHQVAPFIRRIISIFLFHSFEFVSDFVLRISDFLFMLAVSSIDPAFLATCVAPRPASALSAAAASFESQRIV